MRVLVACNAYLPIIGGVEVAVDNCCREFAERGHEVMIVTTRTRPDLLEEETVHGFRVLRLDFAPKSGFRIWKALNTLWLCFQALRKFRPDVVYVHFLAVHMLYFSILKILLGFPYVLSARGNDVQVFPWKSRTMYWGLRFSTRVADAIVFNSEYLRDEAEWLMRGKQVPVHIVGDGGNPGEFLDTAPADLGFKYLFAMGRFVQKKGFDILIETMALLGSRHPDLHLVLAGDGAERDKIEALIESRGLTERVHLTGFLGRSDIARHLRGCELFVLPSRIEPVGIVNIEAMMACKAVVATRVGGVPDIVLDGETGLLAEPEPHLLAEKISALVECRSERDAMGAAGRARAVANFTWARIAGQYLTIFDSVIRSH